MQHMVEDGDSAREGAQPAGDDISAAEAAAYIVDLCDGMAGMARRAGLMRTALALETACRDAVEETASGRA